MAGGAGIAKEAVNKLGNASDLARLFPGYQGKSNVNIPTGYNFAMKQDPMGGVIPSGLQTQQVNVDQLLKAIKPADVLGITGAQQAYSDVGMGRAPSPMDVLDVAGLGATGLGAGKGLLKTGVEAGKFVAPKVGQMAEQYAVNTGLLAPLNAYHGSPYLIDKFDIAKIGTGEGSQAYGHGMYYAGNMPTARQFSLLGSSPGLRQGSAVGNDQAKLDAAVILNAKKFTSGNVSDLANLITKHPTAFAEPEKMLTRISEYIENKPPGYLYKVDIPDKVAKTFLDWDNPISFNQQGIKALQKINKKYDFQYDNSFTGGDLYKALTVDFIRTGKATNEKEAQKLVSNELNKLGIKGIQHIDPNARDFKNYVVFDPSIVKILERNNKPMK